MKTIFYQRVVAALLTSAKILVPLAYLTSTQIHAQALDTVPPVIGEDTISEARKGDSQVFSVSATDNEGIASIDIYYRTLPEADFITASMTRVGSSDLYSFTVPAATIPETVEVIQYYIVARDDSGNRTLHGFSFSPRERKLLDMPAPIAGSTPVEEEQQSSPNLLSSLSTTQKVVYGGLAVIFVGALAAAASDGGGGGNETEATVPVTIVVDPLL
jgi:hypothetical protein